METLNLDLDNLPNTNTVHHVVCEAFNSNLVNSSFIASL